LFFISPVLIPLQELVFFSQLKDKLIKFLIIDLDSSQFKDISLQLIDDDILLTTLNLGHLISSDCCLAVVKILAVHLNTKFLFILITNCDYLF